MINLTEFLDFLSVESRHLQCTFTEKSKKQNNRCWKGVEEECEKGCEKKRSACLVCFLSESTDKMHL